ncbi:hypothetical protein EON79_21760 [bacterium]|nr:MAG: hypothetical protein EON79_21760 [bacterium]
MIRGRIAALALVPMLTLPALAVVEQGNPFEPEILKFEEEDAKNPPQKGGIVFVGSSSIRMWNSVAEDFPHLRIINRGFGGSQVSDSVHYADRIVTKYEPKMVVFFAGTNDLASGKQPATVLADYRAFVEKVRAKVPDVPIVYIAVTPAPSRWNNLENVKLTNTMIRGFSAAGKNLKFVDVYPRMLSESGGPRPELFLEDQLHMKRAGYDIWIEALKPFLPKQ